MGVDLCLSVPMGIVATDGVKVHITVLIKEVAQRVGSFVGNSKSGTGAPAIIQETRFPQGQQDMAKLRRHIEKLGQVVLTERLFKPSTNAVIAGIQVLEEPALAGTVESDLKRLDVMEDGLKALVVEWSEGYHRRLERELGVSHSGSASQRDGVDPEGGEARAIAREEELSKFGSTDVRCRSGRDTERRGQVLQGIEYRRNHLRGHIAAGKGR